MVVLGADRGQDADDVEAGFGQEHYEAHAEYAGSTGDDRPAYPTLVRNMAGRKCVGVGT